MNDPASRNATAFFPSHADSETAARELEQLGVPKSAIHFESANSHPATFVGSVRRMFTGSNGQNRAEGTLLSIDERRPEFAEIVRRNGGEVAAAPEGAEVSAATGTGEDERLRLREERLTVDKKAVQCGEVRLRKEIVTESQTIEVPLRKEEVYLQRRSVANEEVVDAGEIGDEEEIRIPISREEVQVQKRTVVTEEIAVGKRSVEEMQRVAADVRKERVQVVTEGDVQPVGEQAAPQPQQPS